MKRLLFTALVSLSIFLFSHIHLTAQEKANPFLGMWTLDIEGGSVGWLEVHEKEGFLDANLLWRGGSVLPVANIYMTDAKTLVVSRIYPFKKADNRTYQLNTTFTMKRVGDQLIGVMSIPSRSAKGIDEMAFVGHLLPAVPAAPDLSKLKYGEPVELFNGKDLSGWHIIRSDRKNGFKAVDGVLINDPVQPENGPHYHYGNLRTEKEFMDFNLSLEVNVPKGNNSGVYLRGMYEIQVLDSYGMKLDSHHMGAVYSRIKPSQAAEKEPGSWQKLDITLCQRHISVKLNGKLIIDNQAVHGPTGGAIISDVFAPGPIYLQGDHGKVQYRNIVLTPILN